MVVWWWWFCCFAIGCVWCGGWRSSVLGARQDEDTTSPRPFQAGPHSKREREGGEGGREGGQERTCQYLYLPVSMCVVHKEETTGRLGLPAIRGGDGQSCGWQTYLVGSG